MTKKTKIKIIVSASLITLSASVIPYSIIKLVQNYQQSNEISKKYQFLEKTFDSKKELQQYATSLVDDQTTNIKTATSWTINVGNKMISFNTPTEVINFLNNYINEVDFSTNKNDFNLNLDNSLVANQLKDLNFSTIKPIKIYRGKNNTIHLTEKSAKDSYLSIHNVYYFDNLFFRSKEELSIYLEKKFSSVNDQKQVNSFVLKNKNNEFSLPITTTDLNDLNNENSKAFRYINNFIDNNNEPYFKFQDPLNNIQYFNKDNLIQVQNIYQPSFVKLSSNEAKGNWIVDLEKEDKYDLLGPYYIKADSTIQLMKNKENWRKIEGNDFKFIEDKLKIDKINNFFNSIIIPTTDDICKDLIFKIDFLQKDINDYFSLLKSTYPEIYDSIYDLLSTMFKGKKYNEFLKLPILFVHTIDKLVQYNAEQKLIDLTREIYSKITDYFDLMLSLTVPKDFLLSKSEEPFSFKTFFGINKQTFDLNTDIESLSLKIYEDFLDLEHIIDFIGNCLIILEKLPFLTSDDFNEKLFSKTFNFKIDQKNFYTYKLIWDVLVSKNYEELKQNIFKIYKTHHPEIKDFNFNINQFIPPVYSERFIDRWIMNKTLEVNYDCYFNIDKISDTKKALNKVFCDYEYKMKKNDIIYVKNIYSTNKSLLNIRTLSLLKLISMHTSKSLSSIFGDYRNLDHNFSTKVLDEYLNLLDPNENANNHFTKISNLFSDPLRKIIGLSAEFFDLKPTGKNETYIEKYYNTTANTILGSLFQNRDKINTISSAVTDIIGNTLSITSDVVNIINQVGKILSKTAVALSTISVAFAFASLIIDIFLNFYKVEMFSYIFEAEGIKYIWNGGREESFFFGLIPGNKRGIEDMKLLEPKQVIVPNVENSYYYNGNKYETEDSLKYVQLNDILNGIYENKTSLQKVYSILNLVNNPNTNDIFIANSVDELKQKTIDHIIQTVNSSNLQNIKNSPILDIDSYKYGTNITFNNHLSIKENIKNIIKDIKPTLIAQTPILDQTNSKFANIPIYNNIGNSIDHSVSEYKLPYNSWVGGNIITNEDNNFVIVDPNLKDKALTEQQAKNILVNNFYNSFNVQSKIIDKQFLNSTTCYSDISETINKGVLYIANNLRNEQKFFFNKIDAFKWLFDEFEFKAYYQNEKYETITFNNMIFNSYNEFLDWVDTQTKEI